MEEFIRQVMEMSRDEIVTAHRDDEAFRENCRNLIKQNNILTYEAIDRIVNSLWDYIFS